jgi:hypothetical protein
MPEVELFLLFVRPLNRARIRYMIGGSVASMFYGEPRLTHDVDFVVSMESSDIALLTEIFPDTEFYVPPPDAIAEELRRSRGQFNVIHDATGFKADFYPAGRDSLNAWGFQFTREIQFEGETVTLAPPEYVIVRKLEYFREGKSDKHLRDIRSMLAISREQINFDQLTAWIGRLALDTEWRQVE